MLNEILCALVGVTGDFIKQDADIGFFVNDSELVTSNAERQLIQKTVQVGFVYTKLREFVASFECNWSNQCFANNNISAYSAAVCCGLENILEKYLRDIACIERSLQSTVTSLAAVSLHIQKVRNYYHIFGILRWQAQINL
jgi:hypothetical protein